MSNLHIKGQKALRGTVKVSGRKNSALKLIAAALLSDKPVTIHNLPEIGDCFVMLSILESLGAKIVHDGSSVTILAETITPEIPVEMGKKLRASLVCVGPLLGRFHQVSFPHPGGCVIGKRSIEPHIEAFKDLGASIHISN
jgi:UDP-N-acetylglucosamine 1-carboxyvinyltransferase